MNGRVNISIFRFFFSLEISASRGGMYRFISEKDMVEGWTKIWRLSFRSISTGLAPYRKRYRAEIPTFEPASFTRDNISDSVDTDPVGQIRHWRCIRSTRFDALPNTRSSLSIPPRIPFPPRSFLPSYRVFLPPSLLPSLRPSTFVLMARLPLILLIYGCRFFILFNS